MNRDTRNLVILAVVATALVAVVLAVGRRDYLRDPPSLTGLDPAAVSQLQLDIPPLAPQTFARRADGWWRTAPSSARAEDERMQHLARLAAAPVARWIHGSALTPANVGLAQPSATLVVNGTRLDYGGLTAFGDLRYVRVGDRVALVPRQYSPEVVLTKPNGE